MAPDHETLPDHETKQAQREVVASADLADAELAAVEAAEIPATQRYRLDE